MHARRHLIRLYAAARQQAQRRTRVHALLVARVRAPKGARTHHRAHRERLATDIKRSISSPTICTTHMSGHSQHGSHWNHISSTWRACTASKSCKRIRKLVAHLQTASLSSKTGPAHPK